MSYLTTLQVPPAYQDAFGRLRVSEPRTLHDSNFYSNRHTHEWAELTSGGGAVAYTPGFPSVNLTSSGAASRVVRQSRRYVPYQPGKSYLMFATGILEMSGGVAGTTARIGLFDDGADQTVGAQPGNGFFFQLVGTALSIVQRSGITGVQVDTVVPQSAWNVDKLDGTGRSGVTLNPGLRQIYFVEMQWLGTGTVSMGVDVDRQLIICHEIQHANLPGTSAYTNRGSLPVRYELSSDGSGPAAEQRQICSTVISEGGFDLFTPRSRTISVNRGNSAVTIGNTTETPILSVRLKALRNRTTLSPTHLGAIITTSNGSMKISLYRFISPEAYGAGPLTGPAWTAANPSTVPTYTDISAAEYDLAATAVDLTNSVYPFILAHSFYFSTASNIGELTSTDESLTLSADIQGRSDWYVVTARRVLTSTGTDNVLAAMDWVETD